MCFGCESGTFDLLTNAVGNGTVEVKNWAPPIIVIYKFYKLRIAVYKQILHKFADNFYIYDTNIQRGLPVITKRKMLI